jgi:hypothetical protein
MSTPRCRASLISAKACAHRGQLHRCHTSRSRRLRRSAVQGHACLLGPLALAIFRCRTSLHCRAIPADIHNPDRCAVHPLPVKTAAVAVSARCDVRDKLMIVLHARQQLEHLARLLSIGARGHGRDKYSLQVASASDGRWHAEIKHVSLRSIFKTAAESCSQAQRWARHCTGSAAGIGYAVVVPYLAWSRSPRALSEARAPLAISGPWRMRR